MTLTIRFATPDDAEAIHGALVGIAEVVGELDKVRSTPDTIRRYGFGEKPAFETLIAEIDGEFAGLCLWFASFSTWGGWPGAYVQDLYVADKYRGAGVGARLLKRLAAVIRQRGGAYMRLAVDTQNFGAQAFYARLGLTHSDSEQVHAAYGEAFDALAEADEGADQEGLAMKAFFADEQRRHDPTMFLSSGAQQPNPEKPERVERLLAGARAAGCTIERPKDFGLGPVAAVHTPEYLEFLEHIFVRWQRIAGASAEVIPNIHPLARGGAYPATAVGQAGYHMADTACPISADTYRSALWSASSAVAAAEAVIGGEPAAYALCRPPGHHAFADAAGGFCFLNNSAIAAQHLLRSASRVAILDVDLHHGNGTQGIFYARDDVLTVSIHADPVRFYPFFWGHADERGAGAGLGYNLNLPLERKSGDAEFLAALATAFRRIRAFAPDALVVALGLDAFEGDPFGGLSVTTPGFSRIGEAIAALGLPTVIVQEGGYLCDELGDNLTSFLTGFAGAHRV